MTTLRNLSDFLFVQGSKQAELFLDNRMDDGQFEQFGNSLQIMVPEEELEGWACEFAHWLEDRSDEMVEEHKFVPEFVPMTDKEFLSEIEAMPADKVKQALLEYMDMEDSEGYSPAEMIGLFKFQVDFVLYLKNMN